MSITFTKVSASTTTTITPIVGTVSFEGSTEIRGGGTTPAVAAGNIRNGSGQVVVTNTAHETTLVALQSISGAGDYLVAGSDVTGFEAYSSLVDVTIGEGDGVEIVLLSWKGTVATA